MTILNNVLLSLAIAPLALSIAFAQGGDDPVEGIDIIITEAGFANTNVKQPIVAQERKMMMRKTIKPLAQVNPTRPMMEEKETIFAFGLGAVTKVYNPVEDTISRIQSAPIERASNI